MKRLVTLFVLTALTTAPAYAPERAAARAAMAAVSIATPALAAHKSQPVFAHHNGCVARSGHCDYRDFHVWDQTYHCLATSGCSFHSGGVFGPVDVQF
jgi:hypothetical protein